MAAIRASSLSSLSISSSFSSFCQQRRIIKATVNAPKIWISPLSLPNPSDGGLLEELSLRSTDCRVTTTTTTRKEKDSNSCMKNSSTCTRYNTNNGCDPMVIAKLYAIMEAVADRVEMHKNIGEQRNNWNHLLLTSINAMTLTAATMCGVAATTSSVGHAAAPLAALKASSTVLYLAATGLLAVMNKIQPSQLAEEQRNAARLFKQLHGQIHSMVSIGNPTGADVNEVIQKVLAIDRAYPLPLLGAMLEKFPSNVEPAVWWPCLRSPRQGKDRKVDGNGWNKELEDEMRQVAGNLERKDKADYLRLGKIALAISKVLAISGPVLTGLAALGSAFVGTNPLAVVVGVAAGALASIVNAMEHGGQVGMVFEMYRSNAGFFQLMQETIESNVNERIENGQVFEMKVALQLGRSLSELRNLATFSASNGAAATEEFACKLF